MKKYVSMLAVVVILLGIAVGLTQFSGVPKSVDTSTDSTSGDVGGRIGILPFQSGIIGTVYVGPSCPVMRMPPNPDCADQPYVTTVRVFAVGGPRNALFSEVKTDKEGKYRMVLPPGDYILRADGGDPFPSCEEKNITVGPDTIDEENLLCDTGIR